MIKIKNKVTLLIFISLVFSILFKIMWIYIYNDSETFKFNNQFMINTNDGYFYAEGARDILNSSHQKNDLSPIESSLSVLTSVISRLLPFDFETIILYMPVIFSSLLVIPIMLISKRLNQIEVGFIASLLSPIVWSYYNRTLIGYYDTDMLNIVFPVFLLWSLILALKTKEDKYILFTGVEIIAYRWWYPQSYSLEFAFFILITLYTAYLIFKKQDYRYELKLITTMLLSMVNLPSLIRMVIVFTLYIVYKKNIFEKYLFYFLSIAIFIFIYTGGLDPIWVQLKGYVFKDEIAVADTGLSLHFFTVMQTIREAGKIPFETFANRISGHTIIFIVSFIGYLWLSYKHKVMLLGLPLLGLGLLAYVGGLRFTIYAVPIMALGYGFIVVEFSNKVFQNTLPRILFITIATLGAIYPNISHAINYKIPTVFVNQEVKVLDKLKSIVNQEDYVISWWDYGYPIRYYTDVKTLIDGGKHSGAVNFPISYIINSKQNESAQMARLDVEYTEKKFNRKPEEKWASSNIEQMTLDYGFKNTNNFLTALETDLQMPKKTRDIYLYLPNRMLNILPTISLFSNIDLMTGEKGKRPLFFKSNGFKEEGNIIVLSKDLTILKDKGQIKIGNRATKLNNFVITQYDNKGKLRKRYQKIDRNSNINVIFMKNYNTFLVLDNKMYESLFIQLFVLEDYDKNLFEAVIFDPLVKVYKLKI